MEICTTVAHGYNGGDRESIFLALTKDELDALYYTLGKSYHVSKDSIEVYKKVCGLVSEVLDNV